VNLLDIEAHAASFRDPAGFILETGGELYRAIHPDALADVSLLYSSGLHDELVADGLLVPHLRVTNPPLQLPEGWTLLKPKRLAVISYASEWTDGQLQAAALLTLELQRRALAHGLSLKDASAFNVQFDGARAVFIDLLSFTRLGQERAWPAYRQFCEHFLAPLALRRHAMSGLLSDIGLEGIPLGLASHALPASTWLRPSLAMHVHLHALASAKGEAGPRRVTPASTDAEVKAFRLQLVASLTSAVRAVGLARRESHWVDYRQNNVYSGDSADSKRRFVEEVTASCGVRRALDLGANDGHYARVLAEQGVACTAVEADAACSEAIFRDTQRSPYDKLINTVRVDLTNPTPAHGWANAERASFVERMRCDLTLSLALLHHLSITHQVPFSRIAKFLAELAPIAVVEYVPPDDRMALQLLAARTGVTESYRQTLSEPAFVSAFGKHFVCVRRSAPLDGGRVLYHFARRA
jgi:hypothetical protein